MHTQPHLCHNATKPRAPPEISIRPTPTFSVFSNTYPEMGLTQMSYTDVQDLTHTLRVGTDGSYSSPSIRAPLGGQATTILCMYKMLETSNLITFNGLANSSSYDAFLLDEERGRDHRMIAWPATPSKRDECKWAGKDLGKECSNFIRVLQPYNQTHLYICGTGAFHPICSFLEMGKRAEDNVFRMTQHFENGRGKSPYDPKMLSASLLIDGELYSGTSADFMGRDFAIFRTLGDQHPIRTEQHDSRWLNDPRFISVHLIPESDNPEDDKIFLFFKENAMDGEHTGKATIARIGQLCKNDMGGHRSLVNKWTTFLKARLMCSVPGVNGIDTHFDELQDVFLMSAKDPKESTHLCCIHHFK
ncbi:hypothetical protein WMY93_025773 [Mugilogobius chulae]|uniref:Sema domain-containing protein n=1 Tax=Mugilogobius chulae TaxID=88201 RepID=A0AAW0N7Z1_9GOBI